MKNILKKKPSIFGTWNVLPSPEVAHVLGASGLDYVFIDLEHGCADSLTVQRSIQSLHAQGSAAIVRVGDLSEAGILRALDSGADGVLAPHVATADDCKAFLDRVYYQPKGRRGYSPYTPAAGYKVNKNYFDNCNEKITSGVIIEGDAALGDVSQIVADERLDFIYVGTYDISAALGLPGQTRSPEVRAIVKHCVKTAIQHGKVVGTMFHDSDEYYFLRDIGVRMFTYKVDTSILFEGYNQILNELAGDTL